MAKRSDYEVHVSNVGQVYRGGSQRKALIEFNAYVAISKEGRGRAGGESVTLFKDGEVFREFYGELALTDE
jgi:hypothetical protein